MRKLIYFLIVVFLMVSCRSKKSKDKTESQTENIVLEALHTPDFTPGPHAMVYKTTQDFSNLVPIQLDTNGQITSYPDPRDYQPDANVFKPVQLSNGYWLDKKGISTQVAYLDWTIEEYSKMETPSIENIKAHILIAEPLLEMCDCGNANSYTDIVKQINAFIQRDSLNSKCRKLK